MKQHEYQSHIHKLSTSTPAFCAVCRRQAGPKGFGGRGVRPLWACNDPDCQAAIQKVRKMTTPDFNELEKEAVKSAGRAGFAYLESLGKDGLYELSREEAEEFFERAVDGFGAHLRERLTMGG